MKLQFFLLWVCVWIIDRNTVILIALCQPSNDSCSLIQMIWTFNWNECWRRRHHRHHHGRYFDGAQFIATQCVAFVIHVAGAATLLDYSTLNSSIQPIIRDSMKRLIMSSSLPESTTVLKMIQENVSRAVRWHHCEAPLTLQTRLASPSTKNGTHLWCDGWMRYANPITKSESRINWIRTKWYKVEK